MTHSSTQKADGSSTRHRGDGFHLPMETASIPVHSVEKSVCWFNKMFIYAPLVVDCDRDIVNVLIGTWHEEISLAVSSGLKVPRIRNAFSLVTPLAGK